MTTRVRSRGGVFAKSFVFNQIDVSCSSGTVPGSSGLPYEVDYETMSDTITSRFYSRRAKGEVFFSPMSHTKYKYLSGGGVGWKIRSVANSCTSPVKQAVTDTIGDSYPSYIPRSGTLLGVSVVPPASIISSSDINMGAVEASTQALANIDSGDQNLIESLAEFHQSLNLLGDSFKVTNEILNKIPRTKLKGATNAYLLYRYGLRPVISDIQAVLKHMNDVAMRERRTFRGYSNLSRSSITSQTVVLGATSSVTSLIRDSHTVQFRAMTLCEYLVTRSSELGFTTKNLLTVPWELIPYSFVVDYYVNIGSYLKAIAPTPGVDLLGSCLTIEEDITSFCSPINTAFVGSTYTVERPVTGSYTSTINRKIRTSLASPSVVVKSDFRFDNLSRVLDQVALVVQRLVAR